MIIYFVYLGARSYGFHYHNAEALSLGADWLAIGEQSLCGVPDNRRGTDLPSFGICHAGKQLDGAEYTVHVDGILLSVLTFVPRL